MKHIILVLLLFNFIGASVHARSDIFGEGDDPALYYANEQTYDADLGVLILRGKVELLYKGEILEADYVTYSEKADLVTASGNVRLRRPDGDITFGDYAELTGNMKEGFIRQAKAIMKDDAKVASVEVRKFETRQEFDKASYTPCKICGPGDTPTWQLNSSRVVKDETTKRYYFTDSTMEILGVPILYFPFLYHPTQRESGLLAPLFGKLGKDEGYYYAQPVYIVIGREDDLTITPIVFTNENPMGMAQYRRAFSFGNFNIGGSFIEPKSNKVTERRGNRSIKTSVPHHRGHVWGSADFSVTEAIRFRAHGGWVSDETYFRKYPFFGHTSDVSLNSEAALEGFWDRDYAVAKVQHFQTLVSTIDQEDVADALPHIEYHAVSGRDPLGGRLYFDTSFLNLSRIKGRNLQRGVGIMGWRLPWALPYGQYLSFFAEGRSDIYNVEGTPRPMIGKPGEDGTHYRLFPKAGAEVRWPVATLFFNNITIFEPIGQIIVSSKGLNPRSIPNEDSVGFEFSDSNLFSPSRIPGKDMVDEGSRADYGLQMYSKGTTIGDWEAFLGQTFNLNGRDKGLTYQMQGLNHRSSDYVARLNTTPIPGWLEFHYKGRFSRQNLENRFAQLGGSVGPPLLKFGSDYIFVSKKAGAPNMNDFRQLSFTVSSKFLENWSAKIGGRYDFSRDRFNKKTPKGGKLSQSAELAFQDDCLLVRLAVARNFYRDRDLKPGTEATLSFEFKNLGKFSHKVNLVRTDKDKQNNRGTFL